MNGKRGRIASYLLLGAACFLVAIAAGAGDDHDSAKHMHDHGAPATAQESGNPLIDEMQTLDGVFREVVSAVSVGNGVRVYNALHSLHGTMERTHEGVRHGTVKLAKNADKLETFMNMDREFHGELDKLAAAAKKTDQQAMLTLTKRLLDGCVKCHGMFR